MHLYTLVSFWQSSWRKNIREKNHVPTLIQKYLYMSNQKSKIEQLKKRKQNRVVDALKKYLRFSLKVNDVQKISKLSLVMVVNGVVMIVIALHYGTRCNKLW